MMSWLQKYPFVSLSQAQVILRVAVAIFFMAHAAVRIANGSIPQFAGFLPQRAFHSAWVSSGSSRFLNWPQAR